MTIDRPVLAVKDLKTYFSTNDGTVKAVDGVSFELEKGETLGVVGESGSGKSVLNLSLMRLVPHSNSVTAGEIVLDGTDLNSLSEREVRRIRGRRMAMIFQDPMASLNPYLKISTQMTEITRLHRGHGKRAARDHAVEMLRAVGIPDAEARIDSYPHEFSGGMRQRAMIAMAMSCEPEVLIADEPTTALDVTIQAQILELIKDLRSRTGTSVILVTHDLGVVAGMAERIVVMYAGKVFEQARTKDLFARPANPYTIGLLKSVPDPAREKGKQLHQIRGLPPDVANLPPGCPFSERCDRAEDICRREFPPFIEIDHGHHSLCHFAKEVYAGSSVRNRSQE